MTTTELTHAAELLEDTANYLTDENVLPCDEGNALAESLATLSMNLRRDASPDLLNALQELVLRTRQFIAGDLVTFPAALLPQCEAIISKATGR